MRAMHLDLIGGYIDGVQSYLIVDWTKPIVLNKDRIVMIKSSILQWLDSATRAIKDMEGLVEKKCPF